MKNLLVLALVLVMGSSFAQDGNDSLKSYVKITITKTNNSGTSVKNDTTSSSADSTFSEIGNAINRVQSDSTVNSVEIYIPLESKMFIDKKN
jgi:5,10-methylene-tetrahydrofolate dehydrogenase/methenyl tetrahydrofolate cyclohydrolase